MQLQILYGLLIYFMFFSFIFLSFIYLLIIFINFAYIFLPPFSLALATPTSHSQSYPFLTLSMGPLYMFFDDNFPSFPHYFPLHSLLVTVSLLLISISLVIFFLLFCWFCPTYRWDHMVFVFHWVVYFTKHNALQFHPCCHKG